MLLSRYQVMNGMTCTKVRSHIEIDNPKQFHEMSMIGYVDSVEEMRLILEEIWKKRMRLIVSTMLGTYPPKF